MDQSRVLKWNGQKKKSLMRLQPDNDRPNVHIMRTNYLDYIQRDPLAYQPTFSHLPWMGDVYWSLQYVIPK